MNVQKKTYSKFQDIKKQGINNKDQDGNTALMNAIMNRDTPLRYLLLKEEFINLNTQNKDGDTALMLVGRKNDKKLANRILDAHSTRGIIDLVIEWENTGHCISVEYINSWFKEYKAYLYIRNVSGRTVMDIPLISELLLERAMVDINVIEKHINISLEEALIKGYERIVMIFCKSFRIDSFDEIKVALEISRRKNYMEIVKNLEEIEIIVKNWFSAVRSSNIKECSRIIDEYHININIKDSTGKTALDILRYPRRGRYSELVKIILLFEFIKNYV